ncbi:Oidioi.mRNA.OKI2018_I69.chr1.g2383.t1.cds [Oikopleura dioica]|uniref:Oidioi.mRNA.OKI2018_I69.chr1.g2383.t1.cds n=1 Tax=Oikopleura dioica TaxID=34765 RepID=A0ABN7SWA9_OIKDI|nr:Oidioi.mRNA.OKI2018_I69.chr1.g2383.t1.cds [Oikopleura dioica]
MQLLRSFLLLAAALTTPATADCPPDAKMDLVFLVDTSSSIRKAGQKAIESIRSFVYKVVDGFTMGPDLTSFGAISYNKNPQIEFFLGDHDSKESIKTSVDLIDFETGKGTETGKAMNFMAEMIDMGFGQRNDSKVVAIVITDGRSSEKHDFVVEASNNLKKVVDIVIAVGVNMKKENELSREIKTIASEPDEHYAIEAESFESLSMVQDIVKNCICIGISKQHCMLPSMSADDSGFDMRRGQFSTTAAPLKVRAGGRAVNRRPIAGSEPATTSSPFHVKADSCCGQITFNSGIQSCCATHGDKRDENKFLIDIGSKCPAGSSEVWNVQAAMSIDDMDSMHFGDFDIEAYPEPLDFEPEFVDYSKLG